MSNQVEEPKQNEASSISCLAGPSSMPPPPPSPPQNYHRTRRRDGDGCLCGLFDCLCCLPKCICECGCCLLGCVFDIIFSILIIVVIVGGLLLLIIWIFVQPHGIKFKTTNATLATFRLDNTTNILHFDLAVNLSARNPNRHIGVHYKNILASLNYDWHRLKSIDQATVTFYQGRKNTTLVGPFVFTGQNMVVLRTDEMSKFQKESQDGVYEMKLKLRFIVMFKIGFIKTGNWKPKVKCRFKVPLDGKSSQKFQETKCQYYFWV